MTVLRAFLDQVRINPRFAANCAVQPNLERAFANTEYFFGLLEREQNRYLFDCEGRLKRSSMAMAR